MYLIKNVKYIDFVVLKLCYKTYFRLNLHCVFHGIRFKVKEIIRRDDG